MALGGTEVEQLEAGLGSPRARCEGRGGAAGTGTGTLPGGLGGGELRAFPLHAGSATSSGEPSQFWGLCGVFNRVPKPARGQGCCVAGGRGCVG